MTGPIFTSETKRDTEMANKLNTTQIIASVCDISHLQQAGQMGSQKAIDAILDLIGTSNTDPFIEKIRGQIDASAPGRTKIDITEDIAELIKAEANSQEGSHQTYKLELLHELYVEPVISEEIVGTQADADRRLGEIWNASPAVMRDFEYKATATRVSNNTQVSQIGGWEEDDGA